LASGRPRAAQGSAFAKRMRLEKEDVRGVTAEQPVQFKFARPDHFLCMKGGDTYLLLPGAADNAC